AKTHALPPVNRIRVCLPLASCFVRGVYDRPLTWLGSDQALPSERLHGLADGDPSNVELLLKLDFRDQRQGRIGAVLDALSDDVRDLLPLIEPRVPLDHMTTLGRPPPANIEQQFLGMV